MINTNDFHLLKMNDGHSEKLPTGNSFQRFHPREKFMILVS